MQTRSKTTLIKTVLLATIVLLAALFLGQSIIKNDNFGNTFEVISTENGSFGALSPKRLQTTAEEEVYVRLGGKPIGISIGAGGLILMGQSAVVTDGGEVRPTEGLNLNVGDVLTSVNGEHVAYVYQLKKLTQQSDKLNLKFMRKGRPFEVTVVPAVERASGQKKLGMFFKEDVGGVGTLTFVTEEGRFAALGHYIADAQTGLSYELSKGKIYKTSVDGVIVGEKGNAGGLIADVNRLSNPIGEIERNTLIGIYGSYDAQPDGERIRVAKKGEAKVGAAKVYTTIEGENPKFYDIEIVKVVSQSEAGEKGMVILVKDKELLKKAGGIVQGMSGSPIVQNGLLVGAVTHVFLQDPTRGFAVHGRFMYQYANQAA